MTFKMACNRSVQSCGCTSWLEWVREQWVRMSWHCMRHELEATGTEGAE